MSLLLSLLAAIVAAAQSYTIVPYQKTLVYPSIQEPVPVPVVVAAIPFAQSYTVVPYQKSLLFPSLQEPVPVVVSVTVDDWYEEFSQPTRRKDQRHLYPTLQAPITEITAVDKWFQEFDQPTRRKDQRHLYPSLQEPITEATAVDKWFQEFDQPTRRITSPANQPYLYFFPSNVSGDLATLQPIPPVDQPTLRKDQRHIYPTLQQAVPVAETVTLDKWFSPTAQPTRRIDQRQIYPSLQEPVTEAITVDKWVPPLSQPTLRAIRPTQQPYLYYYYNNVSGDLATLQPIPGVDQPTRRKDQRNIYPSLQEPVAIVSTEVVTLDKWFEELSQPTRRKDQRHLYPTLQEPVTEATTVDKWVPPLSQPTLRAVRPTQQPYLYYYYNNVSGDLATLQPIPPLDQPTRRKDQRHIYPSLQEPVSIVEVTAVDKWFEEFSQPTRRKDQRHLYPSLQEPITEAITVDKWVPPLSQPTLRISRPTNQPYLYWYPNNVSGTGRIDPIPPVDQPTLRKDRRHIYPTLQEPVAIVSTETVTVDKWFKEFSQPTRRITSPVNQPYLYWYPNNVSGTGQLAPIPPVDQPTRRITSPANQPYLYWDPTNIFGIGFLNPIPAVDQPTFRRDHRRLYPTIQEPVASATVVVAETVTIDKWYVPLSRPTRRVTSQLQYLYWAPGNVSGTDTLLRAQPTISQPTLRRDQRHIYPTVQGPVQAVIGSGPGALIAQSDTIVPYQKYLLYPSLQATPLPIAPSGTETQLRFTTPLSLPTRRKDQRHLYPTLQQPVQIFSQTGNETLLRVIPPVSQPTRRADRRHIYPTLQEPTKIVVVVPPIPPVPPPNYIDEAFAPTGQFVGFAALSSFSGTVLLTSFSGQAAESAFKGASLEQDAEGIADEDAAN